MSAFLALLSRSATVQCRAPASGQHRCTADKVRQGGVVPDPPALWLSGCLPRRHPVFSAGALYFGTLPSCSAARDRARLHPRLRQLAPHRIPVGRGWPPCLSRRPRCFLVIAQRRRERVPTLACGWCGLHPCCVVGSFWPSHSGFPGTPAALYGGHRARLSWTLPS